MSERERDRKRATNFFFISLGESLRLWEDGYTERASQGFVAGWMFAAINGNVKRWKNRLNQRQ